MPRDYLTARDLYGKLGWSRIECDKCGRSGRYNLRSFDPEKSLIELRETLIADCSRRIANKFDDQCGARFSDLPKIL